MKELENLKKLSEILRGYSYMDSVSSEVLKITMQDAAHTLDKTANELEHILNCKEMEIDELSMGGYLWK